MDFADASFLLPVSDVLPRWRGRDVLVAGCVERGRVRPGDDVEFVGYGRRTSARVGDIVLLRERVAEASTGMSVGLLFPGAVAGLVEPGQVVAAPGAVGAHLSFAADLALLSEEHGATELRTGDGLGFHLRTAVARGTVVLPRGTDVLHPLHTAVVTVVLERPLVLEPGQVFAFRQRGRAAGSGTVRRILG
ncbi:hypothetical protein ACFYVL_03735 [Streptomyces sp. NPDC004111]|uniref:EF-Tu C-terminal domain-related protein n=1 Tax=Streptomyces sp. NPDC004111 TaxID=3364690 RepID=UPI0036CD529F